MAKKELMIDTSILIDYFRKTDKRKSRLIYLSEEFDQLLLSILSI
jgi:tRNA(fMet)-specific endonuclease VapC